MTPDQINDLRHRVLAKEEVTEEELAAAIVALRQGRFTAATTSAAKRTKAAPIDLDSALATLGL